MACVEMSKHPAIRFHPGNNKRFVTATKPQKQARHRTDTSAVNVASAATHAAFVAIETGGLATI